MTELKPLGKEEQEVIKRRLEEIERLFDEQSKINRELRRAVMQLLLQLIDTD